MSMQEAEKWMETQEETLMCCEKVVHHDKDVPSSVQDVTVLREYELDVNVNGEAWAQILCTPLDLEFLILGHLVTTGVVKNYTDIRSLSIDRMRNKAHVCLVPSEKRDVLNPIRRIHWRKDWILAFGRAACRDTALHQKTGAAHSCMLAVDGKICFRCEDISRHNAIDKAIGWMIQHGAVPEACALYTTGRMPVDMVAKAACVGIGILAGKLVPTAESIRVAKEHGLVLLGKVSETGFLQYAGVLPDDCDVKEMLKRD